MIPPPVLELTFEQEFQLRALKDAAMQASKLELATLCLMLQQQNFMYKNTLTNLVKHWDEIDV